MPVPKANQRAVNKYVKNNYDRINVTMPKGQKEVIQATAVAAGESANSYINTAIIQRMDRDSATQEAARAPAEGGGLSLPPETIKAAQEAAEAAGEAIQVFVGRAVTTQAQRDRTSRKLGINPATGGKLKEEA